MNFLLCTNILPEQVAHPCRCSGVFRMATRVLTELVGVELPAASVLSVGEHLGSGLW
jgi:hypothetical protein